MIKTRSVIVFKTLNNSLIDLFETLQQWFGVACFQNTLPLTEKHNYFQKYWSSCFDNENQKCMLSFKTVKTLINYNYKNMVVFVRISKCEYKYFLNIYRYGNNKQ